MKADVAITRYKMHGNNPVEKLESIHVKIAIGKELFTLIEKAQIGEKPQICILCDITETQLLLNYLHCIIVEENLHHSIKVRGN